MGLNFLSNLLSIRNPKLDKKLILSVLFELSLLLKEATDKDKKCFLKILAKK